MLLGDSVTLRLLGDQVLAKPNQLLGPMSLPDGLHGASLDQAIHQNHILRRRCV